MLGKKSSLTRTDAGLKSALRGGWELDGVGLRRRGMFSSRGNIVLQYSD